MQPGLGFSLNECAQLLLGIKQGRAAIQAFRLRVATSRLRAAWRSRGPKPTPSRRYGQAAPAAASAPRTGRHGELVHQPRRSGHGRGVCALTSADEPPGRRATRHKCNVFALGVMTPRARGDGDVPALRWQQQRVLQVPKPLDSVLRFFSPNLEVMSLAPPSPPLPPLTCAFAAPRTVLALGRQKRRVRRCQAA